jgi:small multidrug resistance family-3 protein
MATAALLAIAALLEVGGDALMRLWFRKGSAPGLILGGAALVAYGLMVNVPRWDFGRLLGVYIAVFFVVSQAASVLVFREPPRWPALLGGTFIVLGGLIMTIAPAR